MIGAIKPISKYEKLKNKYVPKIKSKAKETYEKGKEKIMRETEYRERIFESKVSKRKGFGKPSLSIEKPKLKTKSFFGVFK